MLNFLPPSVSSFGSDIDGVIRLIYWIVGSWFVVAEFILIYFLLRYRYRDGVRAAWAPGNTVRAAAWILVPAALILVCDLIIEGASARVWAHIKEEIPKNDVLVRITSNQFSWRFTYTGPDGRLDTADDFDVMNDMVVPVGKVVRFQLESMDVLHALWIPHLRLKQDAVPGRSIPGWFEATREGKYPIACAELCGVAHSYMKGTLQVVSPKAYADWVVEKMKQQ